MKKFLSALFLFTSFAHAEVSCDISVSALNRLKMTDAEEAKIQLFLESRNYNYNPTYSFMDKSYDVSFSSLHIAEENSKKDDKLFIVRNLDLPQKASAVEIALFLSGEPIKILKPKRDIFGYFGDNGTPGFKLAMALFRDLPKCNKKNSIAVNDGDRNQLKEIAAPYSISGGLGVSFGSSAFGY